MRHNKPKISVLLTTYARPDYLSLAIKSVLNQDFKDFELIILDDASPDNTDKVIKKRFKDPRIIYIKNKKNLGFPANFKNGVIKARGKYIFLLSDDDLILRPDTLTEVYKAMEKNKAGFGELGLIFYDSSFYKPTSIAYPSEIKQFYLPPSKDIVLKMVHWHLGFASGNIYRRDLINLDDIVNDVWFSHVRPIYRLITEKGALYMGNHFIVGRISKTGNISYLNIDVNKKFHINIMFNLFKMFDKSKARLNIFKKIHLDGVVKTFTGIKYYTSNKNVYEMAKELIKIDRRYLYSYAFWLNLIIALLTPRIILGLLREIKVQLDNRKMKNYIKLVKLNENLKEVLR